MRYNFIELIRAKDDATGLKIILHNVCCIINSKDISFINEISKIQFRSIVIKSVRSHRQNNRYEMTFTLPFSAKTDTRSLISRSCTTTMLHVQGYSYKKGAMRESEREN